MTDAGITKTNTRSRSGRRLVGGLTVLVATDLVGGLTAVGAGVNTWGEAWGSKALLAAPLPMIAAQATLGWLAIRTEGRSAAVPAGLLSLACATSVVSGFFDGGLGNDALSGPLVGFQLVLLGVTGAVGVLAAARARDVLVSAADH
jgi:hypothetical protein